ncbi:MAG TPA: methionine--tRNA ligase subunit beta [Acidobacteriaceae bacterium]|nr:methionine--tRNA ligase subunit beta [Acidobacteriaceae bacterium]
MPEIPQKFYLTTPIYYVNARPHIGHAYSTIAADVIARRHRLLGDDTFFLTGTDEHGQKVQRSAEAAGIPPQQFADEVSATFRGLWDRMGITYNGYIRTTDECHKRGVQKLWKVLEERGAIYLSSYTGQYCVSEETFVEGPPGTIGPDGKATETVTEENYFFKLSDYQEKLIDLIESGTLHVQPEAIKNEVLSFIRGGLKDVSISRTSVSWGVPVPGNEKHTVYVWFDALINYMTAVGYGSGDPADIAKFEKYWPADVHLVGKEITRFHCVYWPAFLMAAGLPLPKSVVANGWLLFEESKMSKSRGNVVRTETVLDAFGPLCPPVPVEAKDGISRGLQPPESTPADAATLAPGLAQPTKAQQDLFAADVLRYFLLREIPFGQDGSFSFDALITRYNADLANGYGNLVSRTLKMIGQYFRGSISSELNAVSYNSYSAAENAAIYASIAFSAEKLGTIERQIESLDFSSALANIQSIVKWTDDILSVEKPWKERDTSEATTYIRTQVLYQAAESIRIITALLHPMMPSATASVWRQLGLGSIEEAARNGELKNLSWGGLRPGTKLGPPLAPIFPRADKGLAQIMTEMEQNRSNALLGVEKTNGDKAPLTESFTDVAPRSEQPPGESAPPPSALPADSGAAGPGATPPLAPQITIDDFAKVDLRVAKVLVAERIPKADKLLRLEVDLGFEKRQILAGIAEYYAPETLIGRNVVIVANLAPRKMRGFESNGMIVAASVGPDGVPVLAGFAEDAELGARLK